MWADHRFGRSFAKKLIKLEHCIPVYRTLEFGWVSPFEAVKSVGGCHILGSVMLSFELLGAIFGSPAVTFESFEATVEPSSGYLHG